MLEKADLIENLRMVELYVSGQGDKFHPLSDELSAVIDSGGEPAEILQELTAILDLREKEPHSKYHLYHNGKIRNMLSSSH